MQLLESEIYIVISKPKIVCKWIDVSKKCINPFIEINIKIIYCYIKLSSMRVPAKYCQKISDICCEMCVVSSIYKYCRQIRVKSQERKFSNLAFGFIWQRVKRTPLICTSSGKILKLNIGKNTPHIYVILYYCRICNFIEYT